MVSRVTKLWEHPDIKSTKVHAFRCWVNAKYGLRLENYEDLWEWSVEHINDFWLSVWMFTRVVSATNPQYAISPRDSKVMFPPVSWFPEARLNFAQNILESPFASSDAKCPVVTTIEEGDESTRHFMLSELTNRVGRLANALRRAGVVPLDRVACIGSNCIETMTVFLASAAVGASFTCCSPELGARSVLDRLQQTKPKILFADDSTMYNGKLLHCLGKVAEIASQLHKTANLERLVVIQRSQMRRGQERPPWSTELELFVQGENSDLTYYQTTFSHPLVIVYSSGTTGQPKCLVHSSGGVLMKQKAEQILSTDMGPGSIFLQYSSTNWIMYLYSVTGLLSGAHSILYDGSPTYPRVESLLDILSQQKVTHFGTSAHYLSLLQSSGVTKQTIVPLPALKCITSTGSVLTESQYHWTYETFGPIQLSSIAGGTDIAGAFVGGSSDLPVYAGWCQARALGMKVQVYSDEGLSIEHSGESGELVCTAPFPSQPRSFWGDSGDIKHKDAYFTKFAGKWHQGDYIRLDPETKGVQFLGRSDGILNPGGVRFGSAEIYNALSDVVEIEDCLCIGQRRPHDAEEAVLLFVKPKTHPLQDKLQATIRDCIASSLSKRHVPKYIFEIPDIPMTINGKKAELPVKKIVSGQKVVPSSTMANPGSLKWYRPFADLPPHGGGGVRKIKASI